ncbi:MAG: adenylyl-sulfate kinase [Bacteroidota bacterium]
MEHIYPIFDQILARSDKETQLKQHAQVVWFTGLSGSGKSTIARSVEGSLHQMGFFTKLLDGDNVRAGLCKDLSFSQADREENIRRIAEVAKLFLDGGIICLCSFVSPTHHIRSLAQEIIGKDNFLEVYVNASLETCEQRDVKGLYKKARAGEIKQFTGIDSPYEVPTSPFCTLDTNSKNLDTCREELLTKLLPLIQFNA